MSRIHFTASDSNRTSATSPRHPAQAATPTNSASAVRQAGSGLLLAGAIAALLLAAAFLGFLAKRVYFTPRQQFAETSHLVRYRFVRDAFSDEISLVDELHQTNAENIFSPENLNKFLAGQGLEAEWVVRNDPRAKYKTSMYQCGGLKAYERYSEEMNPQRRLEVADAQGKFQRCAKEFQAELPLTRSIKIGIDDTNGVDDKWREFVTRKLATVANNLSSKDTIKLVVFRITGTTFLDMDDAVITPHMPKDDADKIWNDKLKWLLAERKSTKESSIAAGLFNVLSQDQDIRLSQVYLFSDGIENSPQQTISFYPLLRSPHGWEPEKLDAAIKKGVDQFPDLTNTAVTWYFPPVTWLVPPVPEASYRTVQKYWRHVLVDLCHSKSVTQVY